MKTLKKKLLFNPEGDDSIDNRKIVEGNSTNLFNLNNVKYTWANRLYRAMMENFWIPEKVDLTSDVNHYTKLTDPERRAYDGVLSFLVFLDSLQTNNVPKISEFVTAPEINLLLAIQTYQEAVHSQSYAYIIETVIPTERRDEVYDFWREDKTLLHRNRLVAGVYQEFHDTPTRENFVRVLIADYLLEALYFYNGFNFFYNLASRNLMPGTSDIIRYINRDELSHVVLFQNIMHSLFKEEPEMNKPELIKEMFDEAVMQEIAWTNHILGNEILGVTEKSTEEYTRFLANERLKSLGLEMLYPGFVHNPYKHLMKIADAEGEGDVKSNFFESTVTSYNQSSAVKGWDEI
jgi:ribonucleoside-diphosphate reductase beta chain